MGVIAIKQIRNLASGPAQVRNRETPHDTDNGRGDLAPGEIRDIEIWIPWCADGQSFGTKHMDVTVVGVTLGGGNRTFTIWQASHGDGDRVRLSTDGAWHDPGAEIGGYSAVGLVETATLGDDRTLLIHNTGVWLVPHLVLVLAQQMAADIAADGYRICDEHPRRVPSVPKRRATAFSMAGPPTDALDRQQPGARFLYRDSGKRYAFTIVNGTVSVQPPPAVRVLQDAISYHDHRRGDWITPLPIFDLIAANNGRVFAKEKDTDRFFFAILDEMFIHGASGRDIAVPSSYFKLDPEFNTPGAQLRDVLSHLDGDFAGHPATERFPLFRFGLSLGIGPTFDVRVRRGVWHLLDARPPVIDLRSAAAQTLLGDILALNGIYGSAARRIQFLINVVQDVTPPAGTPVYEHVRYCPNSPLPAVWQHSIDLGDQVPGDTLGKVLGIGVGHVHLHDQYERITGGEMQMLTANPQASEIFSTHGELYRFMNGPIDDLDGYNDGTCNYYVLAQLHNGVFALLYIDEQTFFSQRWRLVGPDDRAGLMFSLTADLAANPARYGPVGYPWDERFFWSPFGPPGGPPVGPIGDKSRLAVSAQVVLVTADLAPGIEPVIYSINFSWGTMDRTWRWRLLPPGATVLPLSDEAAADETIPPTAGNAVFPQTIRLRGDLTLHLMGTREGVPGRWYQRYLPASNQLVPPQIALVAGQRPPAGYAHPWKFLPETMFTAADRFSHFGVYDQVDSRMKYYPVDVNAADVPTLDALAAQPDQWWSDDPLQPSSSDARLYINRYTFNLQTMRLPWPPWPPFPQERMVPASLYNPDTMLRLVRRGTRWIALHWDKRDDDMLPFDGLPRTVTLKSKARDKSVQVTIHPAIHVDSPPAVATVYFWWEDATTAGIGFIQADAGLIPLQDNVWRIRMAAFDDAGTVITLQDVTFDHFAYYAPAKVYIYRWIPTGDAGNAVRRYATADAMVRNGTSIWFEDVTGHVAPPEQIRWMRPAEMRVTVVPATIPRGIAVPVTVHASDANTGEVLQGSITIDADSMTRRTDEAFTYTFIPIQEPADPSDPGYPRPGPHPRAQDPSGIVSHDLYPDTPIPFVFYNPTLHIQFDPTPVPAGRAVPFLVQVQDNTTHVPVPASVTIGSNAGLANASFACVFAPGVNTGSVHLAGYPAVSFTVSAYTPAMQVTVDPSPPPLNRLVQITVHAVDATTGVLVPGTRVKIDGRDVAGANTAFGYTFRIRRSGPPGDPTISYPTGIVSAPGYADALIDFGFDSP